MIISEINLIWEKLKNPGTLLASGGLTFLFRILSLGLNFAVMVIITNLHGDGIYGNYSLAFTLAQACALVCALGFPNALIGYIGLRPVTDPYSQHLLLKGVKFLSLVSIIPALLFFFAADQIAV